MALATAPILLLPNFELPFVITTNASEVAVGAILEQNKGRGLQLVAFANKKLDSTEMRYSTYERELLGIVWALGHWRHYIEQSLHKSGHTDRPRSVALPPKSNECKYKSLEMD